MTICSLVQKKKVQTQEKKIACLESLLKRRRRTKRKKVRTKRVRKKKKNFFRLVFRLSWRLSSDERRSEERMMRKGKTCSVIQTRIQHLSGKEDEEGKGLFGDSDEESAPALIVLIN